MPAVVTLSRNNPGCVKGAFVDIASTASHSRPGRTAPEPLARDWADRRRKGDPVISPWRFRGTHRGCWERLSLALAHGLDWTSGLGERLVSPGSSKTIKA